METISWESKELSSSLHLLYCIHQFIYQLTEGEEKSLKVKGCGVKQLYFSVTTDSTL